MGEKLANQTHLLEHFSLDQYLDELGMSIGEKLLSVHKSYLNTVFPLIEKSGLHAISHITGGGILENTSRVVSEKSKIKIDWKSWKTPYIFDLIEKKGNVPIEDMRRSFNLGIGMILIVDKLEVDSFTDHLKIENEKFSILGEIV